MTAIEQKTGARVLHIFAAATSLRFLRGQAAYMRDGGFELEAASSPAREGEEPQADASVPVFALTIPRRISPVGDLIAVARLVRLIMARAPRIVHAHTPKGGFVGMIAAAFVPRTRRLYHMRGLPLETATGWRRWALYSAEWLTCTLAHRVICVSPSLRSRAIDLGLVTSEKAVVLGHGSGNGVDALGVFAPRSNDAERRTLMRAAWGAGDATRVVVFVGRLARDKGLRELSVAWPGVVRDVPDALLIVAGQADERDQADDVMLSTLRQNHTVRFVGEVADVRSLYLASDLVVLPTYREGFPNVLLEAAAMERPVVATDVTGCRDAVVPEVTGTLVPARDAEALASAIVAYANNDDRARKHGMAARERVVDAFQPVHIWHQLTGVYEALLRM